jgi:hypothetical protein
MTLSTAGTGPTSRHRRRDGRRRLRGAEVRPARRRGRGGPAPRLLPVGGRAALLLAWPVDELPYHLDLAGGRCCGYPRSTPSATWSRGPSAPTLTMRASGWTRSSGASGRWNST